MKQFVIFCAILGLAVADSELRPREKFGQRIVGGWDTDKGQFNFTVSLHYNGGHACGGSIINKDWIITAAHCCFGSIGQYEFIAGEWDRSVNEGTEQRSKISEKVIHPQYDDYNLYYDVCMCKLETPLLFTSDVGSIVPAANYVPNTDEPDYFTVTGWGLTQENGSPANILQYVNVPHVDRGVCNTKYSPYGYHVTDDMICAGDIDNGGIDSCQGDSGGPLFYNDPAGKQVLLGIVSWGIGCAQAGHPGVYSYVPAFNGFIQDCVEGNAPTPTPCNPDFEFECSDGQCIPAYWECDGYKDCLNDEQPNCTCTGFECTSDQKCIPYEWYCDKIVDCNDVSDETNCTSIETPSQFYIDLSGQKKRTNYEFKLP